jgi:2,3-bisphosphoglycerate-independent phosphoglycerate mutase
MQQRRTRTQDEEALAKEKEREERMPGRMRASFAQREESQVAFRGRRKKRKKGPKISESLSNEEKKREERVKVNDDVNLRAMWLSGRKKKKKKRKDPKVSTTKRKPRGGKRKSLL